ncbi:MAG: serine/threonine protein kinase [Candidatus Xenobia bacterium]
MRQTEAPTPPIKESVVREAKFAPMLMPGEVLQERYEVERILGVGGMGGVYLVRHQVLGQRLALKEMLFKKVDEQARTASIQQFQAEARMLCQLRHPALPRVYDFFEDQGTCFLLMDYIEGKNLSQLVDAQGPQDEYRVTKWLTELCDVLAYLHGHSPPIIFRDLKPGNVMLDSQGNLKLIDFGIAKVFDVDGGGSTSTLIRGAGTLGYAAPEQYGTGTDARTDIYALGATLYFLLTGDSPPPSMHLAAGLAATTPLHVRRPEVSRKTRDLVRWMLQLKAASRPASIQQVQAVLGGNAVCPVEDDTADPPAAVSPSTGVLVARDQPTAVPGAPPTASPRPSPPPAAPTRGLLALGMGAAILVMMAMGALVASLVPRHANAPAPQLATLTVISQPPGARIYLNDRQIGRTPVTIQVEPLTYEIRAEAEGRSGVHQTVSLNDGQRAQVALKLPRAPAHLKLTVSPADADVLLDGKPAGPGDFTLSAGKHAITVRQDGFQSVTRRVVARDGHDLAPLAIALRPVVAAPLPGPTPATTALVAATPSPPSSPSPLAIAPGMSAGDISLGMTLDSVRHEVENHYTFQWDAANHLMMIPNLGLAVTVDNDVVNGIQIDAPARGDSVFRTSGGVHVGSSFDDVKAEFGPDYKENISTQGRRYISYMPRGIVFRMESDRVVTILVVPPH